MTALRSPVLLHGRVGRGFGRGSKSLGFPTANVDLPKGSLEGLYDIEQGVYYGWTKIGADEPRPSAISVGDNPTFDDLRGRVVVESYILHKFDKDFYGEQITCILVGFIRKMEKYDELQALIKAIESDVEITKTRLTSGTEEEKLRQHPFFSKPTLESAGQLKALL
eukprot:Hpha_TRINITY_DN10276_c0_g1::TRINITY_DN10276_c0_g1_i2::g.35146::m.35146/K00861/RFK, FMN1; riboflavin kinase